MKPIIVNSYPVNGSENIPLNSKITICFGAPIKEPIKENIIVENLNKNELCDYTLEFSEDSKIINLIVKDKNAIGENSLCGLTKYSVRLVSIQGTTPEKVNLELSFYTEAESPEDLEIKNNTETTVSNELYILSSSPENGDKLFNGTYIRVNLSAEPFEKSVTEDNIYLIQGTIATLEESYLLDTELEHIPCSIILKGKTILVRPTEAFTGNTEYVLIIDGVTNERTTISDYYLEFAMIPSPLYCDYEEIMNSSYFGLLSDGLSNIREGIINKIYRYGQDIEQVAKDAGTDTEIDWDTPSDCVKDYVSNRTLYDYVFNRYVTCVSTSRNKKLADLEISYQDKAGELLKLLNDLENKWRQAEEDVKNFGDDSNNSVGLFVKGSEVDEERSFMTRSFADSEGAKSWDN